MNYEMVVDEYIILCGSNPERLTKEEKLAFLEEKYASYLESYNGVSRDEVSKGVSKNASLLALSELQRMINFMKEIIGFKRF